MPASPYRKPSVRINTPGGAASAEGITVIAAVNSATTVQVVIRRGAGSVVTPLSSEAIARMKAAQTSRFTAKENRFDSTVVAEDGNGGTMSFSGFAVSPVIEQSDVSNSEMINIVGADAFLDGLSFGIYQSRPELSLEEAEDDLFTKTPSSSEGDVGKMLLEISKALVENLQISIDRTDSESAKEVIAAKHAANKLPLAAWGIVLAASDVVYPEWKTNLAALPDLNRKVVERAKNLLQQRSSSFWGIINSLAAEFQFFYKPNMTGLPGKFLRADGKTAPGGKTVTSGVTRFVATDGSASMLPLGGVILYGPVVPTLLEEAQPYSQNAVIGRWPASITPGYFYEGSAPAWLAAAGAGSFAEFATVADAAAVAAEEPAVRSYDPLNYKSQKAERVADLEAASKALSDMLQSYAKVMYEDMRLADSTATMTIPLDFTLEVGLRYTFQPAGASGGQFSGFVRALRHTLQLQGGNQMSASTTLSLTHIIY